MGNSAPAKVTSATTCRDSSSEGVCCTFTRSLGECSNANSVTWNAGRCKVADMETNRSCWCEVVDCKSAGCRSGDSPTVLPLRVLRHDSPDAPNFERPPRPSGPFSELCSACNQSHPYDPSDIHVELLENVSSPIGWCSQGYRQALEQAPADADDQWEREAFEKKEML